jgi:hypothetical protein
MCLNDTSWYYNVDWTAKMSVFFQNSAVAYSRSNGSVLWHSFTNAQSIPVNTSSLQILEAYDHLLLDTTTLLHNSSTNLPLFSGSSFPFFLWMAEPEFSDHNAINPTSSNEIYSTLQALLAVPLYYCQSGVVKRLFPPIMDSKVASNPDLALLYTLLSAPPERSSPASFAYYRYQITVSRSTLIAYIVLSGIALFACSIAQAAINLSEHSGHGRRIPRLSRFPTLDLFTHCTIEDENRCVMYQGRSGFFPVNTSQRSLRDWLSTISINWSRSRNFEDGLQLFTSDFAHEQSPGASSATLESAHPYSSRSKISLFKGRG